MSDCYSLKLLRFKGAENQSIEFPSDGVILLDGRSGIGKTTLLDAISFALYDNYKNSCYPRSDRNSKKKQESTSVELTFPVSRNQTTSGLSIYRQRRPNLLRVVGNNVSLMDDSAQHFIDQTFGSIRDWQAGGYLRQYDFCAFLSMSSSEKLEFLKGLSLPDSFEQLLEKSTNKLQDSQRQLQEIQHHVRVYQEMYLRMYEQYLNQISGIQTWTQAQYNSKLQQFGVSETFILCTENLIKLDGLGKKYFREQAQSKRKELEDEQIKLAQLIELEKQKISLTESLFQLESELSGVSIDQDQITNSEKKIQSLVEQLSLVKNSERKTQLLLAKSEIQKRLTKLDETYQSTSKYTLVELERIKEILDGPSVTEMKSDLNLVEESQKYIKLEEEYISVYNSTQKLEDELTKVKKELETIPEHSVALEIEELDKKIWSVQLIKKKLVCPNCESSVFLKQDKLEICTDHDNPVEESLSQLQDKKSFLQIQQSKFIKREGLEKSLNALQKELGELPKVSKPEAKPGLIKLDHQTLELKRLDLLSRIKTRENTPDIDYVQEKAKIDAENSRRQMKNDVGSINAELDNLDDANCQTDPTDGISAKLETDLKSERLKLDDFRKQLLRVQTIQAQIAQIQRQLDSIPNEPPDDSKVNLIKKELDEHEKESVMFDREIFLQTKLSELQGLYNHHEELSKQEKYMIEKVGRFQKIRSTLITAEYVILDTVLDQINSIISEILSTLFIDPITVSLRSLRQLKTNDRIKPEINIEVVYKGSEFANLNELSGGEKSRVSLALVIAFSQLGKSPFLLLDESLSSLDVITKELAITAIRTCLNSKLTIAVNHDTTEGVYDSVIKLQ